MSYPTPAVRWQQLLESNEPIPREWIDELIGGNDLSAWRVAEDCITRHWHRIEPEMDLHRSGEFLLDYYFACLANRSVWAARPTDQKAIETFDETPHNSYEAAGDLVGLLSAFSRANMCHALAQRLKELYLAGSEEVRNCIECGFLEHALERPEYRPLFQDWQSDPRCSEAFERALEWGVAHERKP